MDTFSFLRILVFEMEVREASKGHYWKDFLAAAGSAQPQTMFNI